MVAGYRKIPVLPKLPTLPTQNFVPPDPSKKGPMLSKTVGQSSRDNGMMSHVMPTNVGESYTGMVDAIKQGVKLKKVDPPVRHPFSLIYLVVCLFVWEDVGGRCVSLSACFCSSLGEICLTQVPTLFFFVFV